MNIEDVWEDFGIRLGPLGIGFSGAMGRVRYVRTEDSHIIRIRIDPSVKKEEIKVRLVKQGLIEVEWPRRQKGEEIPVE